MSFIEYFKDKVIFIIINIIVLVITSYLLFGLNVSSYAIFIICILNFLASISFFIYDCLRKSKYYSSLLKRLDELDKKYFIGDVATEEDFLEGKILFESNNLQHFRLPFLCRTLSFFAAQMRRVPSGCPW